MRSSYLISYDIAEAKRWRQVYRTLRGYGDPLHYSVFRCDLSPSERVLLLEALTKAISHQEDRILMADLGPAGGRASVCIETLGRPGQSGKFGRIAVIV